jgi:GR25 family glycosyltransferase involved in LPS biosynthesis
MNINNLNDLTKNIFVINLKHREDRKNHIINELKKIDCNNYNLVEAVDGKNLNITTRLSNGALGLCKTYLKIYDEWKIIQNNDDICLIEDDCVFLENFNNNLLNFKKNTPEDWEMLYFGGNHNYHGGNITTEEVNPYCIKLNHTFTTHCLIMKKHVFEKLIQLISSMEFEVDVAMTILQKHHNAYCPKLRMTTQLVGYSDIENKVVDYNWLIK